MIHPIDDEEQVGSIEPPVGRIVSPFSPSLQMRLLTCLIFDDKTSRSVFEKLDVAEFRECWEFPSHSSPSPHWPIARAVFKYWGRRGQPPGDKVYGLVDKKQGKAIRNWMGWRSRNNKMHPIFFSAITELIDDAREQLAHALRDGERQAASARQEATTEAVHTGDAATIAKVKQALKEGDHRLDPQSPKWAGKAVAGALGLSVSRKSDVQAVRRLLDKLISRGDLEIVEAKDSNHRLRKNVKVPA